MGIHREFQKIGVPSWGPQNEDLSVLGFVSYTGITVRIHSPTIPSASAS